MVTPYLIEPMNCDQVPPYPGAEVNQPTDLELYFLGRIEEYQPDTEFDLILALNLIEHVANPLEVMTKLKDCLSTPGMVLVKTPNIDSLDHRLFRHKNWGGYHCPRHWTLFDRESFLNLASEAGLRVTYFAYTQGAPFWAWS